MRKILYLFVIIISNSLHSQSGQIIYSVKMDSASYLDTTKYKERLQRMKEYASDQKFKLSFRNNQSSFKYIESLNSDPDFSEKENRIARSAMTTTSDFYYDRVENREIQQKKDGQLIEKKNSKVSWVISTESKKIDSYLCFKATYLESYKGRKSGEIQYRKVVAWFAPSLPYSFGPINFYGLPGLVLELKYKNTTYLATNIVLSDAKVFVVFPKGKAITKEEYETKLKAQMGM